MPQEYQTTLDKVTIGDQAMVVRVGGEKRVKRRLLEMGLVSGSTIIVKAVAPLGDPIEVLVMGYQLSLRKDEAQNVQVQVTD
jgi:Fe2+ transport system protein FeoA